MDNTKNSGGGFGFTRQLHKAVCSDCKIDCEVPFKPVSGRPIYCRECLRNHKN